MWEPPHHQRVLLYRNLALAAAHCHVGTINWKDAAAAVRWGWNLLVPTRAQQQQQTGRGVSVCGGVGGAHCQDVEALLGALGCGYERAGALLVAAADAAAQLVQLQEAEALGVLDDHERRIGHVDADLDDDCAQQQAAAAAAEDVEHRRL